MSRRPARRRTGFTLVELIASVTIFSIAVIGLLEVFTTCLRSTIANAGYTQAVYLAQGLMEKTIAEGVLLVGTDEGDFAPADPGYAWETQILETETTDLYEIRVRVRWSERGREKSYTLTTLSMDRASL